MEGILKDNQYPFGGLFPINIPAVLSGVGKKLRDRMYRTVKPESYSREQLENFIIGKSREAYRDPNSEALLGKYTGQDSIIADYTQAPDGLPIGRVLTQAEIDSLGANNNTLAKYAVNDIIVPSKSKQGAFEFANPNQSGNAPHLPYNYNDVPSSRWTHSKQLGSYEQSKEKEGDRYSITYKDVWDINPFRGKSSSDDPTWQSFIKAGKDVGLDKMGDIVPFGKPFEIHGRQYYDSKGRPVKSKSEGGFLYQPKDAWDSLSMAGKSEMIKVAVKNGITDLKTIREKYNEFAEGGDKETPRPVTTEGAGYIPPVVSGPNAAQAGTLKDIAYRIMSQSSAENRGLGHIAKGVLESIAGQPYDQMYTGSFSGGNDDMEPDTTRDLNHLIVYGNTKGQYQPKELRGFDYRNYLQKNYGVNTMPTYEGRIVMANKVNIPTEYSPLVEWLSDRPKYGYYVDPDKDADVIQDWDNLPFLTVDDTASYRRSFRRDKSGKPELANQDLIDYGGKDYGRKYGTLAGLQGAVLNRVINSPVILDQGLPVNFTNNPEDFEQGEGWYNTLKSIVDINHILQDNGNGNYSYPLVLPDINVFGRKRAEGGKIHIKPENRGKFTALKERTGHSATWFKEHGTPAQKKMATFARNARKWKHGLGGKLNTYNYGNTFGGGGLFGNETVDTVASFLPILGIAEDAYQFYKDPSWANAGWLAASLASDIFTGGMASRAIKAVRTANKAVDAANTANRAARRTWEAGKRANMRQSGSVRGADMRRMINSVGAAGATRNAAIKRANDALFEAGTSIGIDQGINNFVNAAQNDMFPTFGIQYEQKHGLGGNLFYGASESKV